MIHSLHDNPSYPVQMAGDKLDIVVFPWLALGHLLPLFHLSTRLASYGHHIYFLSSPRNLIRLPPIPSHLTHLLTLIPFPLSTPPQLPSNAESSLDLPSDDLRPFLRLAFDSLQHPLRQFLHQHTPHWIFVDYAAYWLPALASEFGIPCVYLSLFNASMLGFMGPPSALLGGKDAKRTPEEFMVKPKWVDFDTNVFFKGYEAREVFKPGAVPDESGVSEVYRFGKVIGESQVIAVRTSNEFEGNWLHLLEQLYQKPVIPIGFFTPMPQTQERRNTDDNIFQWLDKQKPKSVLYAAFGSEAKLTSWQVMEIARGLELSSLPFVWVLRASPEATAALPDGFIERTRESGVVSMGWAPQIELLAHQSMGGFLTHVGWNSVVEGLGRGLAVVLLPLMFEQGLNARGLVEMGISVEVERNEEDGSFVGEEIAKALRLVMVSEEGEAMRTKAMEARHLFGDEELNERYLKKFLDYLVDNKKNKDL